MGYYRLPRLPYGTLLCALVGLALGLSSREPLPSALAALFMLALVGFPLDAGLRTGRAGAAFTWMLFPWFMAWLMDATVKAASDPDSLWYLPVAGRLPAFGPALAPCAGFLLGWAACCAIEALEKRTLKTPTTRPLQLFGLILGIWLVTMGLLSSSLPKSWTSGQFLFPVGGFCLAWLALRVTRTFLQDNEARRKIENLRQG